MAPNNGRSSVAIFLGFTLAFNSIFYFLIAKSGHVGGAWGAYIGCLMWCPGVVALLTCSSSKDVGLGPMPAWASIALYFIFTATIGVIRGSATVLGEEIGWRGFLYGDHFRIDLGPVALPDFSLCRRLYRGTPVWYYLPLFAVMLPLISFVWTDVMRWRLPRQV